MSRFKALVQVCSNSLVDEQIRGTSFKPFFFFEKEKNSHEPSTLCNLRVPAQTPKSSLNLQGSNKNDPGSFCHV